MTIPTWRPNPKVTSYQCEVLATDEDFARGECIAVVEDFGYGAYACALNAATGNWERKGNTPDPVDAYGWAERVAGLHPVKPTDARPPFYYFPEESA